MNLVAQQRMELKIKKTFLPLNSAAMSHQVFESLQRFSPVTVNHNNHKSKHCSTAVQRFSR